ncbi:MAG TPA: hypothetical protein VE953_15405 [Terriglobales bacterium]|nr:hypothetical protein [Terriglobales bacterium]
MPEGTRRPACVIAVVAVALLTSACVKADVGLTVHADDQIDGNIVMAVDRGFAPPGGQAPDALLDQVSQRVFHGTATGSHTEPYADPEYVGRRVTIQGMSLLDFNRGTGDGGLKIVHQGGQFRLSGTVDTANLAPAPGQSPTATSERIARTFDVVIRVTFPGAVTQANGQVSGDTVTWRPRLGQRLALSAVADDGPGPPVWLLPVVLLAGAVALGGLVVRRLRAPSPPADRAA